MGTDSYAPSALTSVADTVAEAWQHLCVKGATFILGESPEVQVSKLDGTLVKVEVGHAYTVRELKAAVELQSGMLAREQRLLMGVKELLDHERLDAVLVEPSVTLTLIRRPVLQAEWLERVRQRPGEMKEAPEEIRSDPEVLLAAAEVDVEAFKYADKELWSNRDFVFGALKHNWLVWFNIPEELKQDREVFLAVIKTHARALKHMPPQFASDREIIMASLEPIAQLATIEPTLHLQTLMSEHTAFVFSYAAPSLKSDRDFMMTAVKKHWQSHLYAAQELWSDREFVLNAVQRNGLLLRNAPEELRADRELVRAAVAKDGEALEHAPAFHSDQEIVLEAMRQLGKLPDCVGEDMRKDRWVKLGVVKYKVEQFFKLPEPQRWLVQSDARWLNLIDVNGRLMSFILVSMYLCVWFYIDNITLWTTFDQPPAQANQNSEL